MTKRTSKPHLYIYYTIDLTRAEMANIQCFYVYIVYNAPCAVAIHSTIWQSEIQADLHYAHGAPLYHIFVAMKMLHISIYLCER